MRPSKPKATYGKRTGSRPRQIARDFDSTSPSPSPSRPTQQFNDLAAEISSSTKNTTDFDFSEGSDEPQFGLNRSRAATEETERKKYTQDEEDDLFAFPESPPPQIPSQPLKLNMRRRERAQQKEKELILKQSTKLNKKESDSRPERRFESPISKSTLVLNAISDPFSPPACNSIDNSPEPETQPISHTNIDTSNNTPSRVGLPSRVADSSAIDTPTVKRKRINFESPPIQPDFDTQPDPEPEPQPQQQLQRESEVHSFVNTPIRRTESTLNVKVVTQAEKDAWSFLEEVVPVPKKRKFVANLGPSKFDKSDSDTDNEVDTQEDGFHMLDNIYDSLSDRIPENDGNNDAEAVGTPTQSWQGSRSTFSSRKTYGSSRSYLSNDFADFSESAKSKLSDAPALDFMEQLGFMDKEEEEEIPEEEEFGGNLKTVHELRMLGGNTRFQDEVQYILDGISDSISSRRSSLLELAEKCLDREFVQDFKVSSMPSQLFSLVQGETDPIATFLIGLVVCSMLSGDKNIGLAASLVQSYEIVPLLMQMLPDTDDILLVVRRKSLGVSKVFQQLLAESLVKIRERFLHHDSNNKTSGRQIMFSRSLIALSSLVSLQGLEDRVDNMLLERMTEKANVESFFDFGEDLVSNFLPIVDLNLEDPDMDDDEIQGYRSNLHLVHLVTAQVEFMMRPGVNSIVIPVAETRDSDKCFLLNLLEFVKAILIYWDKREEAKMTEWCNAFDELSISILKLFILITTNFGHQQVSTDKYSRRGKLFAKIYEPSLAVTLVSILAKLNDSPSRGPLLQMNNLELFSWGLLVNLCESEPICEDLLLPSTLDKLKVFLNQETIEPNTSGSNHRFHCQGYQSLVAGLLITVKGGQAFSKTEKEQIQRRLSFFMEHLSESWGHGLRNQVSRVLKSLEKAM